MMANFLPFKKGAATIARMAKVPVVPIIIKNANYISPKGNLLINPFVTIKIKVLAPLDYADKNLLEETRLLMEDALKTM